MKLYSQLLTEGFRYVGHMSYEHAKPVRGDSTFDTLRRAPRVGIQNVYDYLLSEDDAGRTPELLNMRMPWPSAWFEWSTYPSKGYPAVRMGVLVTSTPEEGSSVTERQKHEVFVRVEVPGYPICAVGQTLVGVEKNGAPLNTDNPNDSPFMVKRPPLEPGGHDYSDIDTMLWESLQIVRLALTFTHCKNVEIVEHRTPPKVARKRAKAGKPDITYKTLVIDPMKEVLRTEGNIEKNGLHKALHICRGHFATYTTDAPLFGRVTGTFWKPMHVRGDRKQGEIKKDYRIDAGDRP